MNEKYRKSYFAFRKQHSKTGVKTGVNKKCQLPHFSKMNEIGILSFKTAPKIRKKAAYSLVSDIRKIRSFKRRIGRMVEVTGFEQVAFMLLFAYCTKNTAQLRYFLWLFCIPHAEK